MSEQRDRMAAARALAPVIEAARGEMEARRCLPPAVVEGMRATDILRAAVPADLDGPELDPLTQVELVEEMSRLDGAVGWCAMIASASSYASGFLEPDVARRWFGPPDASLSGQLHPTGRAERVTGGYRVSGHFRFASGIGHATVVLAGCMAYLDGEVARHENGRPETRSVLFEPSRCTVLDTWDTTGLRATGSHDYVVDDLFVPEEDSWDPSGGMRRTEPLYRFPPLFLAPHCGVPLGIARAAVDAVLDLAADKPLAAGANRSPKLGEHPQVQEAVALAEAELGAARALTYTTLGDLWDTLVAGDDVTRRQRGMYRMTMAWTHQVAKKVVTSMYDVASTSSIEHGSPLDRQLRDIATACQHRMIHTRVYAPAGRLLLGMSSGDPTV